MSTRPTSPVTTSSCTEERGDVSVAHRLIELLWVLGPAFTRWVESHMHEPDLTPQRVRILLHLKKNGPTKMSELRNALGVTATNVTALVDALEKDQMVTRQAHQTDRRAILVCITDHAMNRLAEGCGEFKDRVSTLFDTFSEADMEQLAALLSQMRVALIHRGVLEPVSHCVVKTEEEKS